MRQRTMNDSAIRILANCVKPLWFMLLVLLSPVSHATYSAVIIVDNERIKLGDAERREDADRYYCAYAPRTEGGIYLVNGDVDFDDNLAWVFHPDIEERGLV